MKVHFIQLSDVHFHYENYNINRMRDSLSEYLGQINRENNIDFLVVTGDIAHQAKTYTTDVKGFLDDILKNTNLNKKDMFIIPGNHDVNRSKPLRNILVESMLSKKDASDQLIGDIYDQLLDGQKEFFDFYNGYLQEEYPKENLHFIKKFDKYNVFHINTCLVSGKDGEEGHLLVDINKFYKIIRELRHTKEEKVLNIAIGHHTLDCLCKEDRKAMRNNFVDYNIDLYLSGHVHTPSYNVSLNHGDEPFLELVSGAVMGDDYATPGFVEIEVSLEDGKSNVKYHIWNEAEEYWTINNQVGRKTKSGILNHTIERLNKKKVPKDLIEPRASTKRTEGELEQYLHWLNLSTKNFIVPGFNVPLSIENAWASLHVINERGNTFNESLEKEIEKYHEWERLSRHTNIRKSAQEVTDLGKRVILIGGPGSGKSTLARRAVNRLTAKGEKVLYVRLPHVAKEMEQGKSFEEALWSEALDGYSGNKGLLKLEMGQADILIADGLDECEPIRKRISESLYKWSLDRPNTRVIVTTRPVGYESAQFNSFHHVEILPLDQKEIEVYSMKLLQNLNDDEEKVEQVYGDFKRQLENNKMANVAARSPLLLNFLIQLLVSGKSFGKYRTELYSKILEEWIRQSDRIKDGLLNEQIAIRSIEWIGWILQNVLDGKGGRSKREILQKLSSFIEEELDVRPLKAKEVATNCLQFWVDIGVLEHLRVGYEDGYTFIHLTLGEYAAGKYIASLPQKVKQDFLLEKMHIPIWRETLLLASGAGAGRFFVETILKNSNGKFDLYNDMAFAVAILAEAPPLLDLNKKVSKKSMDAISSTIPILCYETGNALEGIAQQQPDWVLSLVGPLLQHNQEWTKLVSYKLALLTRKFIMDKVTVLSLIKLKLEKSITSSGKLNVSYGWLEWNKVIELAMDQILTNGTLNNKELMEVVEELMKVGFSAAFHLEFLRMLEKNRNIDVMEMLEKRFQGSLKPYDFQRSSHKMLNGDRALLGSILRKIPNSQGGPISDGEPLFEISKLHHAMQLDEIPVFDLYPLAKGIQLPAVDEVIKGMLLVHEIVEEKIYNEVQWVLSNIEGDSYSVIPDIFPSEPNWKRGKSVLNKDLLIEALSHPSQAIAKNACLLLINCFENAEIITPFYEAFKKAEGRALFYFTAIAEYILGENTLNVILERLQSANSNGIHYLFESLSKYSQVKNNELVHAALMKGILDDQPSVVKSASEAILKIGGIYDENIILKLVEYWDEHGVICNRDGIKVSGSSCPVCHVVPNSPLPELIALLKKNKVFTLEKRIYFSKHPRFDVRDIGLEALSDFLSAAYLKDIKKLIQQIKIGREPSVLLEAIFSIDNSILKSISKELLSLIDSGNFDVRYRLLEEIAKSQWIDTDYGILIAKKALGDENLNVRNRALEAYRSLNLQKEKLKEMRGLEK
ncbi:metallophosphoesterase [Bacillus cereus]|uniref:metallophosphoesterase n=1 Tax=Bacillus cereus TaxID=1396 RepID=UPI0024BC03E3|nr:metallophosphoesterase [Bacillus cereus]WLG16650.1 metallophosphoesterase [Bacillus cereus]